MKNRWFISDLHLGHQGIIEYERTQFKTLDEMHSEIIDRWNYVIHPHDRVYILGDVVWKKSFLPLLGKMKGKKVLIKGNHDNIAKLKDYAEYFEDIRGAMSLSLDDDLRIIATHIPVHPEQLERFNFNIHGHLHSKSLKDKRYINVSCEVLDFIPIHINQILEGRQ